MFLRYRASFYNASQNRNEFGIFKAAQYLHDKHLVEGNDIENLENLIHFFDHNLSIPEYYQDKKNRQDAKGATSWFKDSSEKFIQPMNRMVSILERYHVHVERIHRAQLDGRVLYEDDFQITIIPNRDDRKGII